MNDALNNPEATTYAAALNAFIQALTTKGSIPYEMPRTETYADLVNAFIKSLVPK
jgi:hypothetical protein